MATQGILSIVRDGAVQFKVVAGCNGYQVPSFRGFLENQIRFGRWHLPPSEQFVDHIPDTIEEIFHGAMAAKIGCLECLIVMDGKKSIWKSGQEVPDDIEAKYRPTFQNPIWNPRWEHGTADHIEVLEIPLA